MSYNHSSKVSRQPDAKTGRGAKVSETVHEMAENETNIFCSYRATTHRVHAPRLAGVRRLCLKTSGHGVEARRHHHWAEGGVTNAAPVSAWLMASYDAHASTSNGCASGESKSGRGARCERGSVCDSHFLGRGRIENAMW